MSTEMNHEVDAEQQAMDKVHVDHKKDENGGKDHSVHSEKHKDCKECKKLKDENQHLKGELENLSTQLKESDDSYKRKVAEFDNYRKRMLKQLDDSSKEASKKIIIDVLPILDNFERALKGSEATQDFKVLFEGLKITNQQILSLFESLDIKKIDALGKEFDHNLHEALLMEEREDVEFDTTVIDVLENGYLIGDSVLRHSKVKVAKKKK